MRADLSQVKKNRLFPAAMLQIPLLLFFFTSTFIRAQLINNCVSEFQASNLKFNIELVKAGKIKRIMLSVLQKPDLQVITDRGEVQCYEFDTTGLLTRYYATRVISQEQVETFYKAVYKRGRRIRAAYTDISWKYVYDTSFTWYVYDKNRNMLMKRSNYGDFYNTFYYDYDSLGQVKRETNVKETNKNPARGNFELGVQTILSVESFEYIQQSPTQLKKLCYNDDGKIYKQGIINHDSNTVEENYSFVVGYVRYKNTYIYLPSGKLSSKEMYSNSNGDLKIFTTYTYDADGNIAEEKVFTNDVQTDLVAYIYDDSKRLLKSRLDRQFERNSIEIIKFSYDLYP